MLSLTILPSTITKDQEQDAKLLHDLTYYSKEPYSFLSCRSCRIVLPLSRVPNHFSSSPHGYRTVDCRRILAAWKEVYLPVYPVSLQTEADLHAWRPPATSSPWIPELPVLRANHCLFSDPRTGQRCNSLFSGRSGIQHHCRSQHGWKNTQGRGRPRSRTQHGQAATKPWEPNVPCHRIVPHGIGSFLWPIDLPTDYHHRGARPRVDTDALTQREKAWESIEDCLDGSSAPYGASVSTSTRYPMHLDPWIEKTGWASYLKGHSLSAVTELLAPPQSQETGLVALLQAFDGVIEAARLSVLEEKVNVFSLHRVASFIPHRPHKRPLLTKLQEGTYRKYMAIWHKLLCFVYRSAVLCQGPLLTYTLTPTQLEALAKLPKPHGVVAASAPEADQSACLSLCIALLDHKLRGPITESIVVAFLAALGINRERNGFVSAVTCTPDLSALVKMAQLIVVQFAIHEHEAGRAQFASELIAEMQDRFMVFGSETPMNWILNLRAYGARIRDTSTSLGFLSWSDDGQSLSYKSLEMTMNDLRWFLRDQVEEAQEQLHDLLLLPKGDTDARRESLPPLRLSGIKDDPTVSEAGWSFLDDQRNEGLLGGRERWLLRQIRDNKRLCRLFFSNQQTFHWNMKQVEKYQNMVYAFLRRLLLLIHMTSGQPARGTELLTIRWCNSSRGERRNIFVENGLVSFVTSYHKNYSLLSSTKVIHRYLPPEISELVVYYLWLVTPFLEQLSILAPLPGQGTLGSFFWPSSIGPRTRQKDAIGAEEEEKPWASYLLGNVISEEFKRGLKTTANTLLWRHSAIAISRKHLPEGSKFKRDYGDVESSKAMDLQAAHSTRMAGSCYARDLREGAGHVALLRAEFRDLSRHWHTCLGFGTILPPRQTVNDGGGLAENKRMCRKRANEDDGRARELHNWLRAEYILKKRKIIE